MSDSHQIKSGAVLSYIAIVFNIIAGLIYTPWMIKVIGKSDYALYILANSFLTYFVIDFGLWQAIARLLSKYKAEGREENSNNLLGLSIKLYLIIDLVIFISLLVIYFLIENIFVKLTPGEIERFKIVYLIAGFFSVISFPFVSLRGIFISYSLFASARIFDLLAKTITIIIMVTALFLGFGLYSLVLVTGFIGLISSFVKLYYLKRKTPLKINLSYYDKGLMKDLFRTSFWIFMIVVSELLLRNSGPTILGIFSGSWQIAIFAIAILIDGYNTTLANAINGFFLPRITQFNINNNDITRINDLMIKVGRYQLMILGVVMVGFITLGKEFINIWMGSDFERSYYVALFFICPGIIILTQEIPNTLLLVTDKIKYRSYIYLIGGVIGLITTILFAPRFGAIGAGFGVFIASLLFNLIGMNIIYWKKLKLDIPRFFRECHLNLLLPILLSLVAGLMIRHLLPTGGWLIFILKALITGSAYFIIMWLTGMNCFEKQLVASSFRKIIPTFKQKH